MLFLNTSPQLSDTDIMIYKYIMENADKVIYMRVRDLADQTHSSSASILRFCRKFECSGFPEFKTRLKLYLKKQKNTKLQTIDEESLIHFFEQSVESTFTKKINQVVDLLETKEFVVFLGMGSSNIIASYGALYFSSIFTFAIRIEDPSNYPIEFLTNQIADKICLIVLSVSGETKEIIDYMKHLNFSATTIVSITNNSNSTIAKLSTLNIPYYMQAEKYRNFDVTTQVPALYTIERIAKEINNRRVLQEI